MNRRLVTDIVALAVPLSILGCDRQMDHRVRAIDLLKQLGNAEKRPVNGVFELVAHGCGDGRHLSLAVPASSRLTWSTKFPDGGVFTSRVAVAGPPGASALFRVGVSDDRVYEQLETRTVTTDECRRAWTPIEVNLKQYTGWKFSIFYQPRRRTWRLVLGVNAGSVAPDRAYWGAPQIEADIDAAKRFHRRQAGKE